MAGLTATTPIPVAITLHTQSRVLEVGFDTGETFRLGFEFLRVYSPSAEVQGHGPGQQVLQTGKAEVLITALEPVGNYGLKPSFSDGHNTGIYTWDALYQYGKNQQPMWEDYLHALQMAGASRTA